MKHHKVTLFYDSVSQEDRWRIESIDPDTDKAVDFDPVDKWYLVNHGFSLLTPNSACNDTIIDYSEHRIMAGLLNGMNH